jgi:adenosyl cobinamide kinase/adenosyl cobinamide phosphate guanylyltransferase
LSHITLILGGARSGKSRFAQQLAEQLAGDRVLFVATAEAGDAEMADRIRIHRESRPSRWRTLEQPLRVGAGILESYDGEQAVLVDCLTLLVSNALFATGDPPEARAAQTHVNVEVDGLLGAAKQLSVPLILVSGEVGQGLVPETPLGRLYRDLLGWANQRIAAAGGPTYLMVAGQAINVRHLATSVEQAARGLESPREGSEQKVAKDAKI